MLSEIGRMAIVACALPAYVKSRAGDLLRAEGEVFNLRGLYEHAMGMLDEAQRQRNEEAHERRMGAKEIARLTNERATLVDENRLLTREAVDLRADVQDLTTRLDAAIERLADAQRQLNAKVAPDESSVPTMLDEAGGVEGCCWCLADVTRCDDDLTLCQRCEFDPSFSRLDAINRRDVRAASCSSRRTSPDPLDVGCPSGCGAPAGQPCNASRVERCPRCREIDCTPECIAAEQAESDVYAGPRPNKRA